MAERGILSDQKIFSLLNDLNLTLKFLEQRITKLELELKNLNEKTEKLNKHFVEESNNIKDEISRIKNDLNSIFLETEKIRTDLKKKADLVEVKEIKELFDLFNPLKSTFVTKEEVKRMLKELINISEK